MIQNQLSKIDTATILTMTLLITTFLIMALLETLNTVSYSWVYLWIMLLITINKKNKYVKSYWFMLKVKLLSVKSL